MKEQNFYVETFYEVYTGLLKRFQKIKFIKNIIVWLFGIKIKFLLILLSLILFSVLLLSAILFGVQYYIISERTNEMCKSISSGVTSITIEGLTQNKRSLINDYITTLKNQNIKGFVSAFVIEYKVDKISKTVSHGITVASTEHNEVNKISPNLYTNINKFERHSTSQKIISLNGNERKINYWYYMFPITWKIISRGEEKNLRLGVCKLVFDRNKIIDIFYTSALITLIAIVSVLIISTILVLKSIGLITKPLLIINDGVIEVAKGNLKKRIEIKTSDEIGRLADSFNDMTNHLYEKLQMEKFVSTSTKNAIKKSSETKSEMGRNGIKKNMIIFFSDIRGFTAFSEKKQPEEVVAMLNKYLDLQTKIITRNGGDIDKYVGDEVMATFDTIDNALISAIEIQKKMKPMEMSVGIGINRGDVILGSIGAENRMDYTVIGDTVNLGARLCSYAEANQIIITDNIAENLNKKFKIVKENKINVKGKSDKIQIYRVIS